MSLSSDLSFMKIGRAVSEKSREIAKYHYNKNNKT